MSNGPFAFPNEQRNQTPPTVAAQSLSDLRALLPGQAATATLAGTNSIGDGGGGLYFWNPTDTRPDNGTTIVSPNASLGQGRWNLNVGQTANLAGDVQGPPGASVVKALNGVALPGGSPQAGQFLKAGNQALAYSKLNALVDLPGRFRPDIVTDFNADPTGTTDCSSDIGLAFASAKDVKYPAGTFKIASSATIGAYGQTHHFEQGSHLQPASGQTLTIDGDVDAAPNQQIIDLSAGGSVRFLRSEIHVGWLGAKCDGRALLSCTVTSSSAVLTAASATFTSADIGKRCVIKAPSNAASGTVATTKGVYGVTGTGTAFTTDFTVGERVTLNLGGALFDCNVTSIVNNASMLVYPPPPSTASGITVYRTTTNIVTTISSVTDSTHAVMGTTSGVTATGIATAQIGTDDTAAINAALGAAAANQKVHLLDGTHHISISGGGTNPAITLTDRMQLHGRGRDATTLIVSSTRLSSEVGFYALSATGIVLKDFTIDSGPHRGIVIGVHLDGPASGFTSGFNAGCQAYVLENVRVRGAAVHGISINGGSSYGKIHRCHIVDIGDPAAIGFGIGFLGVCNNNEVSQNFVEGFGALGLAGIYVDASETLTDGGPSLGNVVVGNHVTGFPIGIGIEDSDYNVVAHNTVDQWGQNGIVCIGGQLNRSPTGNTISYNAITNATQAGGNSAIHLGGASSTDVVGNKIFNCGVNHGIRQGRNDGNALTSVAARWKPTHAYSPGDRVVGAIGGAGAFNCYTCITGGTSAGSGGPTTTASDILDGTVHWRFDIAHPGTARRNNIVNNVIQGVTGSGIFIETGTFTEIGGNRITDANPQVPGVDAPIRVQNTETTSILDLPISHVRIHHNTIFGGGDSPGISVLTQIGTDAEGVISDVQTDHNTIQDIGAGYGVQFSCQGAALVDVSSDHDDVFDSRGTTAMLGAVNVYNNTGAFVTARVNGLQNRVPSTIDVTVTGAVILIRDGRIAISVTWNPGSGTLGANAHDVTTGISALGAAVGDIVVVSHPYGAGGDGLIPVGAVESTNHCRLALYNVTGSPITTGSATWQLAILKN